MAADAGGGGQRVVVGVKMDSHSIELLTWALVKVAQPGDAVVALHVIGNSEIVDQDGKSSLFSLAKAFDSVHAVYEGFCNLKQVDLKLKICRGSSVRKTLVREAKSYAASKVVVGSSRNQSKTRPSTYLAKYCAKKLPKDCWVLAVSNGKIVYQIEGSLAAAGMKDHRRTSLLSLFHRTLSKNHRIVSEDDGNISQKPVDAKRYFQSLEQLFIKASLEDKESEGEKNCSICAPGSIEPDDSCKKSSQESKDDGTEEKSLTVVPVRGAETKSGSVTMLIKELPECRPGWPLLRRATLYDRWSSGAPGREISVVQWALQLPSRHLLPSADLGNRQNNLDHIQYKSLGLDAEGGAIVAVSMAGGTSPLSTDNDIKCLPKELQGLHERYSATCRLFTYQELLCATSNFLAENLIGAGGSSKVYRGSLPDGTELAVKNLKPSEDVLKEFVLEIEIITTLHHKNIISLVGFCYEDNHLLLVYDLLSRRSLEENLHGSTKDPKAFGWKERYKVALGVAEALNYLHSGSAQPVIHRDVKSSNILLSDDFEPQLSDFGLAKWASTSLPHIICVDVAGTFGYLAPEYFMYGKVTEKIDVYAYGVVLLELLSGRKPISNDFPKGQESLVIWAKPILDSGEFFQLLDPNLASDYDHDQLERMALAAAYCIKRAPQARPQMSLVLKLLQGDVEVTRWARLQVSGSNESELLDDEGCPQSNIQSHLNLALLDLEHDSTSMSSVEQNVSIEDYLQGRWSRSSSFD